MKFSDYYKYSWFSNMAYVVWEDGDYSPDRAIDAANDQERAPTALTEKIFRPSRLGWEIPASGIYKNDDVGFAANLFVNGTEKVLAIRGTELDVVDQMQLDLLQASLLEIGILGLALSQTVSMFNYISRLTQSVGSEVVQVRAPATIIFHSVEICDLIGA